VGPQLDRGTTRLTAGLSEAIQRQLSAHQANMRLIHKSDLTFGTELFSAYR
jgi:hypothetical protein